VQQTPALRTLHPKARGEVLVEVGLQPHHLIPIGMPYDFHILAFANQGLHAERERT